MMTKTQMNLPTSALPAVFLERLTPILGNFCSFEVFEYDKLITIRVNTIKISIKEAENILTSQGIAFRRVPWHSQALVLENIHTPTLEAFYADLLQKGILYSQGLSSLLPVLVLDPKPGEDVLDMCAAPGSKTTQMAALMHNEGRIVAVEAIRGRFYKLKSVLNLLGASIVEVKMMDARRYRDTKSFDKILVDAP